MSYRTLKKNLALGLSMAAWLAGLGLASAQIPRDAIEVIRAELRADRKAIIAEEMKLNERESAAFWPLYRSYRAEVETTTDSLIAMILDYADLYPNLPEAKAREMLNQYTKIEANLLSIKRKYLRKLGKVLPASKVFRFAQLDSRYDLGTRLALATRIPVLPAGQGQPADRPK